ncbi:MAG: hypothetical protein WCY97_10665 [Methanothrix sp.]|jgi:hypothetical protein|uniref:Uncharacterized protein n=1 Tax=Methanothrix harundinacea TaxID=301375 RepID=A0A117LET8_9EURY|nr:MAG: Uncharacterized protein XD72_2369 [Methanothrix harundinacea]MDD2638042.1 hypothetical protein [Methanothrix sp.]MDI9398941.1 hypothetical protein [Euryarchaeota archaeon]KUK96011.1 MAG: Uncharacterized protein XE07_1447 [Methanothrix harundinacea]MCP1391563.1 hypothetical protein [Methanothrix harundinacea]
MDYVTIDGEKYSTEDLEVLSGETRPLEPKAYILLLARVLKDPLSLPRRLKEICSLKLNDEERRDLRMALIRVQIESELKMNEDIQRYQQRRYVSQVIEILLFKELLLASGEPEEIE